MSEFNETPKDNIKWDNKKDQVIASIAVGGEAIGGLSTLGFLIDYGQTRNFIQLLSSVISAGVAGGSHKIRSTLENRNKQIQS